MKVPVVPGFRLIRYFSVASLLGILVVLTVLLLFYRHFALSALTDHETRGNIALARVFANTIWPNHAAYVKGASAIPNAEMAQRPEVDRLRQDVLRQMAGLNVVKVKIYNLDGLTVFSTDPKQIGEDKSTNSGFLNAKAGRTASEITFRNSFDAFEQVINDRNLVSSYIPISNSQNSPVEGVIEVYSDVTNFVLVLEKTQWQILGGVLGSLSLLYLFLLTIVRRADKVIQAQSEEMHEQKQRAEVTLHSIGDAVITTDEGERVEYLNLVAEKLTGWGLREASGKLLSEVMHVCDATTGEPVPSPLHEALAENRIVSLRGDIDLLRRDGSRIGIDDSAAPMHDPQGRVTGGVLIFRDVSAVRASTRQRSWEATHDVLTGLINRREFESRIEVALASARNAGSHHVVGYLDLDQFKVVNDSCGHAAGDDLLKELGALMQSRIRESDTLARLGGDEFGLLLEGCSLKRAQFIAADLLAAVADFRFNRDAKVFTVGVSIGLASVTSESSSSAEIVSMADTACYWAKEQGRNRVSVYRTGDSDMAARRREVGWIARINAALAEDRFTLYHQSYLPLNAAAGARQHFEVLLRMIDEEGNLVLPGSFVPAAERYNLMPAIDGWVVSTVFSRYRALVVQRGGAALTCAINLSGTSLNAEGFLDFIRQQAIEHALPAHSICFEITETSAINNLRKAAEFIQACKSMGFLFALDDFGTGTSSFGYLKNLPVDYLKIDGGFVKNLEHDAIDKAMTETINQIGHIMGIKTVAEYAENDAIIQQLTSMGVDYAQGYGVCLPTPLFGPATQPDLVMSANDSGPTAGNAKTAGNK